MIRATTIRAAGSKASAIGLLLVALMAAMLLAAKPAHAQETFTVTSTGDGADVNLGDGTCDADTRPLAVRCTLRAAIGEANSTEEADTIRFEIGGTGVKTIRPASTMSIQEQVTIDGYTQPGASPNTRAKGTNAALLVELDGSSPGSTSGLSINASNTIIRGLVVNRFSSHGIVIGGNGNSVEGNFLGTNPEGTDDRGNTLNGVFVNNGSNNTIGGATRDKRNLISGNDGGGIGINAPDNAVSGNLIGTDERGSGDLGNSLSGVRLTDPNNAVGGATAAEANTIAFNGDTVNRADGVAVVFAESTGNLIQRNSIFSNQDLGIDLSEDGPTANDGGAADDADTGPNGLQNKPELISATTSGGTATTVEARIDTKPDEAFDVEFFSQGGGDEGKTFIGKKQVQTDEDGRVGFSFSPNKAVAAGQKITATATGPEGTSEFSAPVEVVAAP